MKKIIVFCLGVISFMYILNIGMGFIELIPDNFPLIGNLDEAGAMLLFLSCLKYFGIDLTNLFKKDKNTGKKNVIDV